MLEPPPFRKTPHKRGGYCASPRCEPCVQGHAEQEAWWAEQRKKKITLPPNYKPYRENFVGKDGLWRYAKPELRREVYDRDHGTCAYCHRYIPYARCVIDHVIPWPKGKTVAPNLVVACKACNKQKGNFDIDAERTRTRTFLKYWKRRPIDRADRSE